MLCDFHLIKREKDALVYPMTYIFIKKNGGFPGGIVVKNPPANAGDTGSIPGPGRSHIPRSN